ncbi:hypothetical protein CCP2SC5_490002 [Azospirillaceae bacterium]
MAIRKLVEASLQRLEGQTLVRRNGEEFFFLTDEEKEIGRGIKNVDLVGGEETKKIGELIFDEALNGLKKYRFEDTKRDFSFARFCDLHPVGSKADCDLIVSVITPLCDDFGDWHEARCLAKSIEEGGQVIIKLQDDNRLARELRIFLQTERYIAKTNDGSLPASMKTILKQRADENSQRGDHLAVVVGEMLKNASFYAAGNKVPLKSGSADALVRLSLDYLIRNTFTKLNYLKKICTGDIQAEIKAVLNAPDTADQKLNLSDGAPGNPGALKEVLEYILLMEKASKSIILHDLAEVRFGKRPYGWPEWEVVLLIARLVIVGEVSLTMEGALLPREKMFDHIKSVNKWRTIVVTKRKTVDAGLLQQARTIGKNVFSKMGPDGEDQLYAFLKEQCENWQTKLSRYHTLAATGLYPGKDAIELGMKTLKLQLSEKESYGYVQRFVSLKTDFEDLSDQMAYLDAFYTSQQPTWELLRKKVSEFAINRKELDQNPDAAAALKQMDIILGHAEPYPLIKDINGLIAKVQTINTEAVDRRRTHALAQIEKHLAEVRDALDQVSAPSDLRNKCLAGLQKLKQGMESQVSIAHIHQATHEAEGVKDAALDAVAAYVPPKPTSSPPEPPAPQKPTGGNATAATVTTPKKVSSLPTQAVTKFVKPKVIRPADLKGSGYLKTKADVDAFIEKLRTELENALAADQPIDIR